MDRPIAEANDKRVAQVLRIAALVVEGESATEAEEGLREIEELLASMQARRTILLAHEPQSRGDRNPDQSVPYGLLDGDLRRQREDTVMIPLSEDTTLDVVEQLIAERETQHAAQLLLLETQAWRNQDSRETRQKLQAIEDTLEALRSRHTYLQAMQEKP